MAILCLAPLLSVVGCAEDLDPPPTAAAPARLEPGPVLWPPPESPVLAGMEPYSVRDPGLQAEAPGGDGSYATGWLALYGDPRAEDPFDRPWVLAVAQTINYDNSLGAELASDRDLLHWELVEPDLDSAEEPTFGVLISGLDGSAEALAAAADPRWDDSGVRIELPASALQDADVPLVLLAEGALDSAGLGQMVWAAPEVTSVQWGDGSRRLGVQSFAPDPALELLLRAALGGRTTGRAVVPVSTPADGLATVRRVGDALVLVQSTGFDSPGLDAVVSSLRPTDPARVAALAGEFNLRMPTGLGGATPDEVAMGDALGGRWWVVADIAASDSMLGPVDSCLVTTSFQFPDGRFSGGGGTGGGYCTELGQVGGWEVADTGAVFVHGDLPTNVARIVITTDDGSEHEPALTGGRKLFGLVVAGATRAVAARTYDADGALIVDLLDPELSRRQLERFAENWPATPGG
jgi:hypothetical protein